MSTFYYLILCTEKAKLYVHMSHTHYYIMHAELQVMLNIIWLNVTHGYTTRWLPFIGLFILIIGISVKSCMVYFYFLIT